MPAGESRVTFQVASTSVAGRHADTTARVTGISMREPSALGGPGLGSVAMTGWPRTACTGYSPPRRRGAALTVASVSSGGFSPVAFW